MGPWEDVDPNLRLSWFKPDHRAAMLGYALTLATCAFRAAFWGDIVEVGTFCGSGALALAWGARQMTTATGKSVLVHTLDTDASRVPPSRRRLERCGFTEVQVHECTSDQFAANAYYRNLLGLAYIDADHSHAGCLADLRNLLPCLHERGCFLLHDYHPRWEQQDWRAEQNGPVTAAEQFLGENAGWQVCHLGWGFALVKRTGGVR